MIHKGNKINKVKRLVAIILTFAMAAALFTGCGGQGKGDGTDAATGNEGQQNDNESGQDTQDAQDGQDTAADGQEGDTAMGRYVETPVDLSEYLNRANTITKCNDGTLVIQDYYNPRIVSRDNGATWEQETDQWFTELLEKGNYILGMAYGADGTAGVVYDVGDEGESGGEPQEDEQPEDDGGQEEDSDFELHTECMVIKPDGTKILPQIDLDEDDDRLWKIWISGEGRVFVTTLGDDIYEVFEDGSSEKFLTIENRPEQIQFHGDLMIMDGSGFEDLLLYDMAKEEYIEDEVLNEFMEKNYKDREVYNGGDYSDVYIFPGEEGVLYIAGKKGLHRHVIGGSAIEQLIDGSLSCFNNPSYLISGMVMLPDNEFLGLFINKAVRFTYNPDIPTVPNEKIKVYSLKDNDTLRQAITIFQTENPEIYMEYEVGMGEDGSITREDAIKKLNTQVMAGEGPDVFVLDDMPIDSYIEKGLFLDLSDWLGSLSGEEEIFGNIVDAFKEDGKVYMIPCEIQLPMIGGREKYVSGMEDMESIADGIVKMREDHPEKALMSFGTAKGAMAIFSMVCAPAWKTGDGELDREAIKEFLTQAKRIYDAQMDGISDKFLEQYEKGNESLMRYYGVGKDDPSLARMVNSLSYVGGSYELLCGVMKYKWDYDELLSVQKVEGFEDTVIVPLNGQSKNVFVPMTLIGINAATPNVERAQEFLKVALGKENQSNLFNGLTVNKAAFEGNMDKEYENADESGVYMSFGSSDEDGREVSLEVYQASEGQKQAMRDWLNGLNTPYIPDLVLEDAIYKEGTDYIQGDKSLEDAVEAIEQSVSIYMSE